MKNKEEYFTPNIEDITYNYQCEYLHEGGIWLTGFGLGSGGFPSLEEIKLRGIDIIRVPYLTTKQILEENWLSNGNIKDTTFYKGKYNMYYRDNKMTISCGIPPMWLNYYYNGECKDINTLKIISKLLNI